MPALDFASLSLLTFVSLGLMAVVLPFAMGRASLSPAARHAQRYFLLQATAWIAIFLASRQRGSSADFIFSTLACVAVVTAQWNMAQALQHWLGPRPGRRWLQLCCIAGPLGFALLWETLAWRFAWFSTVQAMGLLLLAQMCLSPRLNVAKGWRMVLCSCATVVAVATLLRALTALWMPDVLPDFAAQTWLNHGYVVLSHIATTLTLVAVLVAWRDESHQRLQAMALTDMLTGMVNRRGFEEQAHGLLQRARREHSPIALVLVDLDHFKRINDVHGHHAGDQALRLFAQVVHEQLRAGDVVARWGGEEFCLLVHALPAGVDTMLQRLREELQQRSLAELGWPLDFSAGCARPCGEDGALSQLMLRADQALYRAKAAGRGQLVFAEDGDTARAPMQAADLSAPAIGFMSAAQAAAQAETDALPSGER